MFLKGRAVKNPLRIVVYIVAALQFICAGFVLSEAYGPRDMMLAALLGVLPVLAVLALRCGPDKEERTLQSQVNKARLRRELKDLEG